MHFEVLVEDQSGKKALEILIPKIIGEEHSFRIHPYKGIGRIPKTIKLGTKRSVSHRILLDQLPRLLNGYGRTFHSYSDDYKAAVVLVCDLDDKALCLFKEELSAILNRCEYKPDTIFCIAVEEGEAWLLGDVNAIKQAYPKAKSAVLKDYKNDSICGTWETLAEAVYTGGSQALLARGWHAIGAEKSQWAENICPHMDVFNNFSPSFIYFRDKLLMKIGE